MDILRGRDGNRLYRLTLYNVPAVVIVLILNLVGVRIPLFVLNVVRATSMFIAVATICFLLVLPTSTFVKFYRKMFLWMPADDVKAHIAFHIHNFIIHILPVILLGLPCGKNSLPAVMMAYLLILIWYMAMRSKITQIYFDTVNTYGYDVVIFGILPIAMMLVHQAPMDLCRSFGIIH